MSLIEQLKSNIVLNLDFRKGSILDQAIIPNTVSVGGTPIWKNSKKGKCIDVSAGSTNNITVADSVALQVTNGSIIVFGDFTKQTTPSGGSYFRLVSKRDGGGQNYELFYNATGLGFYTTSGAISEYTTSIIDSKMIGVTFTEASNFPIFYKNGALLGNGSVAVSMTVNDAPLIIGNIYSNIKQCENPLYQVLIFNVILTGAQISQLYNEWMRSASIGTFHKSNFEYPQLMANGDFWRDVAWSKTADWTISNGKAYCDGTQAVFGSLSQVGLTIGAPFSVEYSLSGVTAGGVKSYDGSNSGTTRTADGVYHDYFAAANTAYFYFISNADFVGYVDWVKVTAGRRVVYYNDFKDAFVSLGTTSAELNGWMVQPGTWKIGEDSTSKYLQCVTDGQVKASFPGANGYTTNSYSTTGLAVLTKNASDLQIDATAGAKIFIVGLTF